MSRLGYALAPIFGDAGFRDTLHFFKEIVLFKNLPNHDLARLVRKMMQKTYAPGDIVFQEGDMGRAFFVVAEGRVTVTRRNVGTGQEDVVAQFGPGEFFGEMVLLDELPRSATCRVTEPTRLYVMYKDYFDSLVTESPWAAAPILHTLARLLSARLRRDPRPLVPRGDTPPHA
jgi:CRP-like cAMP-binding protein